MDAAVAVAKDTNTNVAHAGATLKLTGQRHQTEDLPSLDEIRTGANFDKAKGLDNKALDEAIKGARDLNVEDDKSIVDFGVDEQRAAAKMAEKTVEYARRNDFDAIRVTTAEMNAKMRELNMGDLKPSIWDRFLPQAAAKRINGFLQQHHDISEDVHTSLQALAEEKKKLVTYRGAAEQDIAESDKLIHTFDIKIAQLEIVRDAFQKRVAKFIEENKDKTDEQTTQKLKQFEMVQSLLERKVNAMVSSRADQFTTVENLRNLQATYNVLIQSAEDQANYNRQAWNNTVSILTHSERQKGVQQAIDSQREAAGEWLHARGNATVKSVESTMRILQTGVIEVEKITESMDRAEEANLKLIEGCKVAQTKLLQMSKDIAARSVLVSERTAQAARSSQEEVAGMINELAGARLPGRN